MDPSSSSREPSMPVPMEGLQETGPSPFLIKTYGMVDDLNTNHIVSWNRGGISFVVWDPYLFSSNILPLYFKHNNFSSFVRQLNTYGFRKIEAERWEFMNEGFLIGQRDLLKSIKRRTYSSSSSSSSNSPPSLHNSQQESHEPCGEIPQLREEKYVLMMEISRLKEEEQRVGGYIKAMEQRIEGAEKKQRHMMSFLRRAVENPSLLQQLMEHSKELKETAVSRSSLVKREAVENVSELEALALEMQGYRQQRIDGVEKELDDGFWEELLMSNDEEAANVKQS